MIYFVALYITPKQTITLCFFCDRTYDKILKYVHIRLIEKPFIMYNKN
jgi:hypothetical protein